MEMRASHDCDRGQFCGDRDESLTWLWSWVIVWRWRWELDIALIVGNCVEMEMEAWHSFDCGSYIKLPSPSPHNYPWSRSCQASICISTQLPTITVMSCFHLYLHTITHNLSYIVCQASISISTQWLWSWVIVWRWRWKLDMTVIMGNCVEMKMEAWDTCSCDCG
jgi:hypothetical protein